MAVLPTLDTGNTFGSNIPITDLPTGTHRINGTESFWGFANTRLARFRRLKKNACHFHLKECEFRFNHRQEDIYHLVLTMLKHFSRS